jgi:predicted DsbA family dithiol-disulfide isomerase
MTSNLKIDFVSDIACPWCAVGLASLEQALQRLQAEGITAQLQFQPFQLNPQMGPEGQDLAEHLTEKYGSTPEQQAANWQALCQRAAAVGFEFRPEGRGRTWNTFKAHRLFHWAGEQGEGAETRRTRPQRQEQTRPTFWRGLYARIHRSARRRSIQ